MPRRTKLDEKAEILAGLLSEHGLAAPHDHLVDLLRERRDAVAASIGVTPATAMGYLDEIVLRGLAETLAETLRDEIAPGGGDPWAASERVVFPARQAGRFSWSLGLVMQAALEAGDTDRAVLALVNIIGLSRTISEMDPGTSSVFAPKEGLAYAARVLEAAAVSFAAGDLVLGPPNTLAPDVIADAMAADAVALREMVATA
jgi:hypothetical protein